MINITKYIKNFLGNIRGYSHKIENNNEVYHNPGLSSCLDDFVGYLNNLNLEKRISEKRLNAKLKIKKRERVLNFFYKVLGF